MKTRDRSLEKYQKAFDKAKTQAEKMLICEKAAKDPKFTPCLPSSMDYDAASHQNEGRGCVLFDVDDTLIAGSDSIVINDALIETAKKQGITEAYGFTSMKIKDGNRLALIAYLALSGIGMRGMIAQAEAAPGVKPGLLFELYHEYHTAKKLSPERKAEIEKIIHDNHDASEAAKDQYFDKADNVYRGEAHTRAERYGAKTRMMADFLDKNPTIKNIIVFDDAQSNLLGMLKILYDRQQQGLNLSATLQPCLVQMTTNIYETRTEYRWENNFDAAFSEVTPKTLGHFVLSCMNDPLSKMTKDGKITKGIQSSEPFLALQGYINQGLQQSQSEGALGQLRQHIETLIDYALDEPNKSELAKKMAFSTNFPHLEMVGEVYNLLAQMNQQAPMNVFELIQAKRPEVMSTIKSERESLFAKSESQRQLAVSSQVSDSQAPHDSTSGIMRGLSRLKNINIGSRKKLVQGDEVKEDKSSSSRSHSSESSKEESPPNPNPPPRMRR